jgi:hypothetical protein
MDLSAIIRSSHVQQNIRAYNMALSMASVGHKSKGLPDGWFVLGGRPCHRIGGLIPMEGSQHSFAQIYMLDPDAASDRRLTVFGGARSTLRHAVLRTLHELLLLHNPWVNQFAAAAREGAAQLIFDTAGRFVDMGAGKGYHKGVPTAENIKAKLMGIERRKPIKWYGKTAYGSVNRLMYNFSAKYSEAISLGIKEVLETPLNK